MCTNTKSPKGDVERQVILDELPENSSIFGHVKTRNFNGFSAFFTRDGNVDLNTHHVTKMSQRTRRIKKPDENLTVKCITFHHTDGTETEITAFMED